MAGYKPLKITGNATGLVQEREEFLLPDDAYPTLQNAYVWRERILRKQGYKLLGRLQRNLSNQSIGTTTATTFNFNLISLFSLEPTAQLTPGDVQIFFSPSADTGNIIAPGYTVASDCQVYTNTTTGLFNGAEITISGVVIVPGSGTNSLNGNFKVAEVIGGGSFKLGLSSKGWGKWQSGGTWSSITGTTNIFEDDGNGNLVAQTNPLTNFGTVNYATGDVSITHTAGAGVAASATFGYYPNLPVMGLRTREVQNSANDEMIAFDQKYAYNFDAGAEEFEEFIPGTTWNAKGEDFTGTSFFWSTNYWVSATTPIVGAMPPQNLFGTTNKKLFWVTNNTGQYGANADPPRITDGTTWRDFDFSNWNQIDATNFLYNFLSMLPFRGRMVTFNTWEGTTKGGAQNYSNRIRWSTIGNPFIQYFNGSGSTPSTGSWRDDIRGQGGFLDIPTSEDIVAIGFVRDNLVIYCERSTWQLRYTGRSIAPFQIERVNSELGAQGPFSAIQFDTSLVGIGDKGVVECDSYKSERIDIKIPDLIWKLQNLNNGVFRVHGIRNFETRLAYWTLPIAANNAIFPNQRLVYNYENDSWALFDDSLTCFGNYQPQDSRTWLNTNIPWIECNFPWINQPAEVAKIVGGNQQGFVEYMDELTVNDVSLFISNIVQGSASTPSVVITSPNHNMQTGFVIGISGIALTTPFSSLNGGIYGIIVTDVDTFSIYTYDPVLNAFDVDVTGTPSGTYIGGGLINIRENFSIKSKKFNFLDDGQSIQMGYLDVLMSATGDNNANGISLNVYLNYDDENPSNVLPDNEIDGVIPATPDAFFNSIIPTAPSTYAVAKEGTKFWQRVYCATRANFLTLQYTFSNSQMAGLEQEQDVQIDAQILWLRKGGRITQL